jgi:hypothetical protein
MSIESMDNVEIDVTEHRGKVKAQVSVYEGLQDGCGPANLTDTEMDDLANHLLRAASLMRHERVVMERGDA